MTRIPSPRDGALTMSAAQPRAHLRAVVRITVLSIIVSELITFFLLKILVDGFLFEGLFIALVCSGPISAWIADRQIRMRQVIADQHDRLAELNRQLNVRNRDLDAFARTVAHDLKNPLTTIIGTADLLVDEPRVAADDESADLIRSIVASGDQAVEIIDGLLLLHGIQHEEPDLTLVDAGSTVANALETMTQTVADSRAIVTTPPSFPAVRAYGPWLIQVWINLIGNAIKYGGSPPQVDLAAEATPDGMVRFEVKDNGSGVTSADRDRIFREFERGRSEDAEGHGLGLAIVSRVVSRLNGETGIDSSDGGGSVFWFTIPTA